MFLHSFLKRGCDGSQLQRVSKKICILTKIVIHMEWKYKNILIQGWMLDFLDLMEKEEQDKYIVSLIRSALAGKVMTDNKKWVRLIEKALSSIEETRDKYNQRQVRNANFSSIEKFCQSDKYRNKILTGTGKDRKEVMLAIENNFPNLKPSDAKVIRKIFRKMRKEQRNSIVGGEATKSAKKDIYALADEYAKERKEKATKEELEVWDCIKQLGLPNIYFQQPVFISGKNGKPCKFYIADFLDVDNKIDIEIDGGYHTSEEQRIKDEERERDFKKMGYETLRITNDEVNGGKAIERIKWFRDNNIL